LQGRRLKVRSPCLLPILKTNLSSQ
jgi:hypothetical protein